MVDPGQTATLRPPRSRRARWRAVAEWTSLAIIAVSLLLISRRVPILPLLGAVAAWNTQLGSWGPIVFGLVYVAAVVAMLPASPLTLAAGALYGLWLGTVVVSIASTLGAGLAFLVARYLARAEVEAMLARFPKFLAIDRAIGSNGWKIVALLRLSPAVPFNLQNFLYGLTRIRFWPYLLTSWVAMLPGTFLYISLGHAGRMGYEAVSGATQRTMTPAEWTMLVAGLLATAGVTVYIARLARKALRQHKELGLDKEPEPADQAAAPAAWPWRVSVAVILAVACLVVAALVEWRPDAIAGWLKRQTSSTPRAAAPGRVHTAFFRAEVVHPSAAKASTAALNDSAAPGRSQPGA